MTFGDGNAIHLGNGASMMTGSAQNRSAHHFQYMLLGLLGLILIGPILRIVTRDWSAEVFWLTVGLAMAAGGATLVTSDRGRVMGYLASAVFVICALMGTRYAIHNLSIAAIIVFLLYCVWGIASSLRQVLVGPNVDLNRIAGAVCVYILMGYVWTVLYLLVALSSSNAFAGVTAGEIPDLVSQLTYFSFVTLTTLGYGDVSPLTPISQSLAYLEAIIGQLYVAILIAGLVGAHLSNIRK